MSTKTTEQHPPRLEVRRHRINGACPHCGREENGHWLSPCPSDDCPSHDALIARAENQKLRQALEGLLPMFDNDSPLLAVYKKEIANARAALKGEA